MCNVHIRVQTVNSYKICTAIDRIFSRVIKFMQISINDNTIQLKLNEKFQLDSAMSKRTNVSLSHISRNDWRQLMVVILIHHTNTSTEQQFF